jgi:hypothetical protein
MSDKETLLFVNEDRKASEWINQLLPNFNVITATSSREAVYFVRTATPRYLLTNSDFRGLNLLQQITKTVSPATILMVFTRNMSDAKWAQENGMVSIPHRAIPIALSETADNAKNGMAAAAVCN